MVDFRVSTPIFTAIVPDAPYGTSLKDFLEEGPIEPGNYPALVDGYFVMLKFNVPKGESKTFWVHCYANAGREPRGRYFSEMLYEIEVSCRRKPYGRISSRYPALNESLMNRILKKKSDNGELTETQVSNVRSIVAEARRKNSLT